ncbi:N-acetylmuramoyl-L-alanine amidase [Candidatus Dependentiae bacterium]
MSINKNLYLFLFLFSSTFIFSKEVKNFTIMLDPAGDAQNTGRQIEDCLERGVTLQFAEKLKQEIESRFDSIKVVLTRSPGEKVQNLQNANYANRLAVDFYLSVHFYKESAVRPKVYMYTFSYNDDFITRKPDLYFCPYNKAHLIYREDTKRCACEIKKILENKKNFDFSGLLDLPFKPLIGVKAPALGIEIGLRSKDNWVNYIDIFFEIVNKLKRVLHG